MLGLPGPEWDRTRRNLIEWLELERDAGKLTPGLASLLELLHEPDPEPMHVEDLYIAYRPDGTRAGEFATELEALRCLYREALAELEALRTLFGEITAVLAKSAGI